MPKQPPEDRSTLERDYAETKRMKQIIAVIIIGGMIVAAILQAYPH